MVFAVAGQRTISMRHAIRNIFQTPVGTRRHVSGVKVDQVRRTGHAMRIVTGGAGGLIVHDMRGVIFETLIRQNAAPAVALVAKGIGKSIFRLKIHRG